MPSRASSNPTRRARRDYSTTRLVLSHSKKNSRCSPTPNLSPASSRQTRAAYSPKANRPMKIVFISTEVAPWSKTGGLGDVVGSLPVELAKRGHKVMTIAPRYDQYKGCLLYTSPSPRDKRQSRMPSSA